MTYTPAIPGCRAMTFFHSTDGIESTTLEIEVGAPFTFENLEAALVPPLRKQKSAAASGPENITEYLDPKGRVYVLIRRNKKQPAHLLLEVRDAVAE